MSSTTLDGKPYQRRVFYNGTIEVLWRSSHWWVCLSFNTWDSSPPPSWSMGIQLSTTYHQGFPILFWEFSNCVCLQSYVVEFYLTISLCYQKTKKVSKVEVGTKVYVRITWRVARGSHIAFSLFRFCFLFAGIEVCVCVCVCYCAFRDIWQIYCKKIEDQEEVRKKESLLSSFTVLIDFKLFGILKEFWISV